MENNNEALPLDIQNEIFLRMSVKSLGKSICVSKKWASIIREKYFRDRYFLQSVTRPRLLFVFSLRGDPIVLFHSVYQEKEPLLSSGQQQTRIPLEPGSVVRAVLRGLVCIQSSYKIVLCNPVIKKFLALPELRERFQDRKVFFRRSYLGYDEATDVIKVLCVTSKRLDKKRVDYRVFTVGSGEDCWRRIVNEPPYFPIRRGLCKDGVLYFVALSCNYDAPVMISFNLRSEELNVIELPEDLYHSPYSLVNYNGEIALVKWSVSKYGDIIFWVRNETSGDWREEHIVIPRWRETVGDFYKGICFKGTIEKGELVFSRDRYNMKGPMIVLYYDRITQHLRKFEINGVANDCYVSTYLDHVDSLSLM